MTRTLLTVALVLMAIPVRAADPPMVDVSQSIDFKVGKTLVSRYHYGPGIAKPYFWPLNAPAEIPVTRGWPMQAGLPRETTDHVHQKSAWFCHGDVIPEGIELKTKSLDRHVKGVDFWSETPGHGTIVCVHVGDPKVDGATVHVATKNEWRSADGIKILEEDRVIVFRDLGDARLFILEIDLHASVCPIVFGDTKEGSMGVRVNDEIKAKGGNGTYVNADGKVNEKEVWGRRSDWNDYSGTVGGEKAGIAVFDDSRNSHRACWHSREYGLMAANPFGRSGSGFPDVKGDTALVRLAKGAHLKLRYGLLLHRGDAKDAKVAERYAAFAAE